MCPEQPVLPRVPSSPSSFRGVVLELCLASIQGDRAYLFAYGIGSFVEETIPEQPVCVQLEGKVQLKLRFCC